MNENTDSIKQTANTVISRPVVLIVGVILIFAGFLYFDGQIYRKVVQKSPVELTPTKVLPQAHVSTTKDGFTPQTIQVKKGQSVTWINTDKSPHQVASDPHPTHTNLPGFDSQEALTLNDSFTFTFEKTGTFTYHDNLNPLKFRGTVVVTK